MAKQDILIVGGGIVGLATGLQLLQQKPGLQITILEKEAEVARHQTGHNSGVIHSGVYYKPGSLKAENCRRGYQLLVDFARKQEIPFDLCGKVIVATNKEELPALQNILKRGKENGLEGLKELTQDELKEHEPYVRGVKGIYVPQTGIIDYSLVAQRYAAEFQRLGGAIQFSEKVKDIQEQKDGCLIKTAQNEYEAGLVINCAGLYSDKIAKLTHEKLGLRIIPFRGEYYKLKKEKEYLVKNLIYPVPDPSFPFLGVHFTRMMKGGVEAGPNAVLAYSREGYTKGDVNLKELFESLTWPGFQKVAWKYWKTGIGEMYRSYSKAAFTKALQGLIPDIKEDDLVTGGAGVRAQACDKKGGLIDDFLILEEPHAINVCNAPSPAATSSLAIGEKVASLAMQRLS